MPVNVDTGEDIIGDVVGGLEELEEQEHNAFDVSHKNAECYERTVSYRAALIPKV